MNSPVNVARVLEQLLLATVWLLFATPLSAQSLVYEAFDPDGFQSPGPTVIRERAWVNGALGDVVREATVPDALYSGPVVTFHGRYVLWLFTPAGTFPPPGSPASLGYFDRLTGIPGIIPGLSVPAGSLSADPHAMRLYVSSPEGVTVIEPGRVTFLPNDAFGGSPLLPGRPRSRFTQHPNGSIASIFIWTGSALRTFSFPPNEFRPTGMTVQDDRIYLTTALMRSDLRASLHMLDAVTGALLVTRDWANPSLIPSFLGQPAVDPRGGRLFVPVLSSDGPSPTGSIWILDVTTLNEIAVGSTNGGVVDAIYVDESQPTLLSYSSRYGRPLGCSNSSAQVWADTTTAIQTITDSACIKTAAAISPQAPSALAQRVSGRRVSLSWTAGLASPDFQLEAGTMSGASDVITFRTNGATTISVDGVPPGTYFVRVRAINSLGLSHASNEVQVVVH